VVDEKRAAVTVSSIDVSKKKFSFFSGVTVFLLEVGR
jgi:hypothetical protein